MSKDFKSLPWIINKTVLPQDTDHAGIMWHGSYLDWLEEARVNALYNVGLPYIELSNNGYEIPVIELNIKYKYSIYHGDKIQLRSWFYNTGKIRLSCKTIFLNVKEKNKNLAEAKVDLVLINKKESGVKVVRKKPNYILQGLLALERGAQ